MVFKVAGICLLIIMLLFVMYGCWDKQELRDISAVLGAGLDKTADGRFVLTVEVAHRGNSPDSGESRVYQTTAGDIGAAEEGLATLIDNYLYWGQLSLLIFGSSLNAADMDQLALYFYNDNRIASSADIVFTRGAAADVLSGKFGESVFVSEGIVQALERNEKNGAARYLLTDHLTLMLGSAQITRVPVAVVGEEGQISLNGDGYAKM